MTRYPWPHTRPPTQPELQLFLCLLNWRRQHPDHPALTAMALHAHTRLPSHTLSHTIDTLTDAGLIRRIIDPYVPGPDRWALR